MCLKQNDFLYTKQLMSFLYTKQLMSFLVWNVLLNFTLCISSFSGLQRRKFAEKTRATAVMKGLFYYHYFLTRTKDNSWGPRIRYLLLPLYIYFLLRRYLLWLIWFLLLLYKQIMKSQNQFSIVLSHLWIHS